MSARIGIALAVCLALVAALLAWRAPRAHERAEAEAVGRPRAEAPAALAEPTAIEESIAERTALAHGTSPEPGAAGDVDADADADADEQDAPPPHVAIRARFVDEAGVPIAGVELYAPAAAAPALSDGDGRAELVVPWDGLRGLFPQACTFMIRGPAVATTGERRWLSKPEDVDLGEIVLRPGGSVRGRVVDSAGTGVPDAKVGAIEAVVADAAERDTLAVHGGWTVGAATTTDADGAFLLEGLPPDAFSLDARAPGTFHAISAPVLVQAGSTVTAPDLVLEPAPADRRIAGVVRTQDGAPAEGAVVRLLNQERSANLGEPASTDARGAFAFVVEPDRLYALRVLDHSPRGWPDVNVDAIRPGTTDLVIVFRDARRLRVSVAGAEGRAVRRFTAWLATTEGRGVPGGHAVSEDGAPVDLAAPQAPFLVRVSAPGYALASSGPFDPAEEREPVKVELEPTTGIAGRVVADGRPVAGAAVEAHALLPDGRRGRAANAFDVLVDPRSPTSDVTGLDGEFFLNAPAAGRYVVHAIAAGRARAEVGPLDFDPARGLDAIVLELGPGGAVEGRVLVGPGVEAQGRTVALSRGDGHFEIFPTAEDGAYRFEHLTPGPWQIRAVDASELERASQGHLGWTKPESDPIWDLTVTAGATTRFDLDLTSLVACAFEGRLTIDGKAPAGWFWSVSGERGLFRRRFDSDGRIEFERERAGACELQISAPLGSGSAAMLRVALDLQPGSNAWEAAIETGALDLRGVDAPSAAELAELAELGGQGPETALSLVAELAEGMTWIGTVFAAEEGALTVPRVPAGRIRIYAGNDGASARRLDGREPAPLLELDLAPGETRTVDLK